MQKTWRDIPGLAKNPLMRMILDEGLSNREIGERLGCSKDVVRSAALAYGISGDGIGMIRRVVRARREKAG